MTEAQDRPAVLTEVDGDVWRITLDRPETGNALTPALAEELAAAFADRPDADPRRAAAGQRRRGSASAATCTSFADADDPGAFVGQLAHDWHEVIRLLLALPGPGGRRRARRGRRCRRSA